MNRRNHEDLLTGLVYFPKEILAQLIDSQHVAVVVHRIYPVVPDVPMANYIVTSIVLYREALEMDNFNIHLIQAGVRTNSVRSVADAGARSPRKWCLKLFMALYLRSVPSR